MPTIEENEHFTSAWNICREKNIFYSDTRQIWNYFNIAHTLKNSLSLSLYIYIYIYIYIYVCVCVCMWETHKKLWLYLKKEGE